LNRQVWLDPSITTIASRIGCTDAQKRQSGSSTETISVAIAGPNQNDVDKTAETVKGLLLDNTGPLTGGYPATSAAVQNNNGSGGLTTGEIVAIAVGAAAGGCILLVLIVVLLKGNNRREDV